MNGFDGREGLELRVITTVLSSAAAGSATARLVMATTMDFTGLHHWSRRKSMSIIQSP
jgi:hypothetical protein